jgi:hypothetical protein
MSIPTFTGHSPERWHQIVDIMLEKKPGDRRIHRLRIIAVQESDFNQVNRLALGRPIQHKLEDSGILPDIQHGSRSSKQCHSAVLNKVLTFEIHRYTKQPIAYIENDAVGCFDRIANPLVLIFLMAIGVSPQTLQSLAKTWEKSVYKIRSMYGISNTRYANDYSRLLFGPGQGSTIGPFLWLICFLLISLSLTSTAPRITISSTNNAVETTSVGEAFVDDTGLGTNMTSPNYQVHPNNCIMDKEDYSPLVSNLQRLAQEWEHLLFSTGGALNLDKCFWFWLAWRWHQGKAKLHTMKTSKHDLRMTFELNMVATEVKRIEPCSSYRTLGVHITPSGDSKGALKVLLEAALSYCSNIVASKLTRQETLKSYIQYLLLKLRYQPPLLQLTKRECDKLMAPVLQAILPKMHINRNTSIAIIHGPEELGGLALPHLHTIQGIDKLKLFVGHLRLNHRTAKLIYIDLTYIQIIPGIGEFFLNKDYTPYSWVEKGWLTSLWEFVSQVKLTFSYPSAWQPPLL